MQAITPQGDGEEVRGTSPHNHSNLMTYTQEEMTASERMAKVIIKNVEEHGRHLQAIPREDENGELVTDKNGNTLVNFVYTIGNCVRKQAELLTFYPSAKTVSYVLNKLSTLMEEGKVPTPTEEVCINVGGLLPVDLMVYMLTEEQQAYADAEFTVQGFEGTPTCLVAIPLPDGNFPPVVPQPLMPDMDTIKDVMTVDVEVQ